VAVKLVNLCNNSSAEYILIFFPHAGGSPNQYKIFSKYLPPCFKLLGALLPGREGWYPKETVTSLEDLSAELAHLVRELGHENIVFFGHSMGSLLAYEAARRLGSVVKHLFVSGHVAPHFSNPNSHKHLLDDESLKKVILDLSGTPKQLIDDKDFLELILPTIRQDFNWCNIYNFTEHQKRILNCAITAFSGIEDTETDESGVRAWVDFTSGHFESVRYPGHHFFIWDHTYSIAQKIVQHIEEHRYR
jgi:surfactin synthase thioesterase subunit